MPNEVAAEPAVRFLDRAALDELDQVGRLAVVELAHLEDAELHGGCRHPLLEVLGAEAEAVAQELDGVVVSRGVVRLHYLKSTPGYSCARWLCGSASCPWPSWPSSR